MARATRLFTPVAAALVALLGAAALIGCSAGSSAVGALPDPDLDLPLAGTPGERTAVFAGGCFWGVEAVFEHLKGVTDAVSGYSGGSAETAAYMVVSGGDTGHAEAVRVTYDPSKITYGQLLKVFFSVAHDPTQLNRQGPDQGTQYRSAVFYADGEQKRVVEAYIAQLAAARAFPDRIVTEVTPLAAFYAAEFFHQDYLARHPNEPYIVIHDKPKLAALKRQFPGLYSGS